MKGAREYADLFETGQYGKLYITSGYHARGKTFHIQILPEGEKAKSNCSHNPCLNKDAVEVYGILGGHPGWTEYYGWIHQGPWVKDFEDLVAQKKKEISAKHSSDKIAIEKRKTEEENRKQQLLAAYQQLTKGRR